MLVTPRFFLASILFLLVSSIPIYGQTIETVAGNGVAGFSGDWGPATAAQVNYPGFICFGGNGDGSIFIGDRLNYRVREMRYGGNPIFTRGGDGTLGFSGDGGPATAAQMGIPGGVAADNAGNVFFCDYDNHRIRKIDAFGTITTIAGTGVLGYGGDGGPATAAQFYYPLGITLDPAGNLYIADQYNHRIRKISTAGIITTVVGTGVNAFGGDGGPATAAMISYPNYIRMDTLGNLIVTDNGGHRIRLVNSSGIINTVVGNGVAGYSGDGGPATAAQIRFPGGTSMDRYGNLFFCDAENNVIRMVDKTTGNIYTMAGTGVPGYSGDGGPATAAQLYKPVDLAVDHFNNIYFVDWYNSRIRMFAGPPAPPCDTVTSLSATGITSTSATLNWTAIAGTAGYEYIVDMSATPTGAGTHTTSASAVVGSLTPSTNYFAHVLDSCDVGFVSNWVTVPFTTLPACAPSCDTVSGLTVSGITATGATLNWTAVTGSLGYEYVVNTSAGVPSVAGTHTTATSAVVAALTAHTNYYAHVRDSCGVGNTSVWVTKPFTTATVGVKSATAVEAFAVSAYPNPANEQCIISVDGTVGKGANLMITDAVGRLAITTILSEARTVLNIKGLTPGVYLLTYRDDQHTQTLKLVKE